MTRRCFFVESVDSDDVVTLRGQTAHHMQTVLRLRAGDHVQLRDGRGSAWQGVVSGTEGKSVHVRILGKHVLDNESRLPITLAMAFARIDRMELVLRQATELGVHRFVAFRTHQSQYSLTDAQMKKRHDRWVAIAREALCQCGRTWLPEILILPDAARLLSAIAIWEGDNGRQLKLLASEGERRNSLKAVWQSFPRCNGVLTLVGPEGGWTQEEVDLLAGADFHTVHLGPRILRLETAAVAFLASVQLLWGDMGVDAMGGREL